MGKRLCSFALLFPLFFFFLAPFTFAQGVSLRWAGWSSQVPEMIESPTPEEAGLSPLERDGFPDHGKILIGFGAMEDLVRLGYEHEITHHWVKEFSEHRPHLKFVFLRHASVGLWHSYLSQPDVVGAIWFSHTFTHERTLENATQAPMTLPATADQQILPASLFSAANPNLRFFLYLGCLGSQISSYFNWKQDFKRSGAPSFTFFYPSEEKLQTFRYLLGQKEKDQVTELLKQLSERIQHSPVSDPEPTPPMTEQKWAELEIDVRDVYPFLDPKLIFLNRAWVGVLGGLEGTSNSGQEWKTIRFPIYRKDILQSPSNSSELAQEFSLRVEPIRWSSEQIVDQYQIRNVRMQVFEYSENLREAREQNPSPPVEFHWKDRPSEEWVTLGTPGACPPSTEVEFTSQDLKQVQKTVNVLSSWKKKFLPKKKLAQKTEALVSLVKKSRDAATCQAWSQKDPEAWSGSGPVRRAFLCVLTRK